jgi:hypothetical protein
MISPFAERVVKKAVGILRHAGSKAQRGLLARRIALKWFQDKRDLPLTADHRELYNVIHRLCWRELGEFPNLINCRDFNDKIQWLKLFDQSEEIIRCSDKVLVRDYIRERVGEQYLVKLYQVHDHFSQIDFDVLPNSFVLKTNHDSGTVILVRDKSELNCKAIEPRIEEALKRPYGWENGEWAYSYIVPQVLVEEHINPLTKSPPPDYKFQCVNGVVKFCRYTYDRGFVTKEIVVDRCGSDFGFIIDENFKRGSGFVLPKSWNKMVEIAEHLSEGFKCVRVDLYSCCEKIFVGELTFYPMAGHYKGEGQKKFGKYLDFDQRTFKPFLIPELERKLSRFTLYPRQ